MKKSIILHVALSLLIPSVYAVNCQLEIQLDSKPEDTAWELRGPLPGFHIIDGVTYNYYKNNITIVTEAFDLAEGRYYFLISDFEGNGIQGGFFRIIANLRSGPLTLKDGNGNFANGLIHEVVVPPSSQQLSELPVGDHGNIESLFPTRLL